METWNKRFADALTDSGLGLAEFSRRAELSHVAALRWTGTPTMEPAREVYASSLLRACKVLGVRMEWVLDGELPKRVDEAWPFTTPRTKIEDLSIVNRVLIDRVIADIVEILSVNRSVNFT